MGNCRRRPILRCLAWLAATVLGTVTAMAQSREAYRVIVREKEINSQAAVRFFRRADMTLNRLWRGGERPPEGTVALTRMELREGMEVLELSGGRLQIYLPDPATGWLTDRKMTGRMLGVLLLHRLGQPVAGYQRTPPWITAALLRMLETRLDDVRLPGVVPYPGLRGLLEMGREYPLAALLSFPLDPGDGPAYDLQMEAAEVLLLSVLRLPEGKKLLAAMTTAVAQEQVPPGQAFATVLDPVILPQPLPPEGVAINVRGNYRQQWWWNNVRRTAINPFYPASAKYAELRFREIEIVTYEESPEAGAAGARPGDAPARRACMVWELADRWPQMLDPAAALSRQLVATADLHFVCSEILRPPLEEMLAAYRRLEAGDRRDFGPRLKAAGQDFHRRLARLAAIETRLRELEAALLAPGRRYAGELAVIGEAAARRRQLWPGLHELLDREEAARGEAGAKP